MAEQRTPGTLDGSRGNRDVRDGTLQLRPGMTPGVIGGPVPGNTGLWDTLVKGAERIDAVSDAIQVGRQRAGAAILKETGHALEEVVKGLIPGLLLMLVTVVATTVIGGAIGAAVGFLAGGVGAAPGAVVGADLGFSIGMSILTWMGLAFLAEGIAKGFGEMVGAITVGTTRAWDAPDSPRPRAEIEEAGKEYAHAIALLFKFILMAIVLRLAGPASKALMEQLRKSRLGEGFANWVVANREALLNNPKLRPKPKVVAVSEKPVEQASTPSQVKQGAAQKSKGGSGTAEKAQATEVKAAAPKVLQVRTTAEVNQAMVEQGNMAAWGGTTVTTEVVPAGTPFNMVVSEGQAQALMAGKPAFGGWATPDVIPSQAFARNDLAILAEFKPDVSFVAQVETTAPQTLNRGLVGALGERAGGANQVEFLGERALRLVGTPKPLPVGP